MTTHISEEYIATRNKSATLDPYSFMIISKYFNTIEDYINAEKCCKLYRGLIEKYRFNPITFRSSKERDLFKFIETYYIYAKETPKIGKTEINRIARDKRIKKVIVENEMNINKIDKDEKIMFKHLAGEFTKKLDEDINILKGIGDDVKGEDIRDLEIPAQITKLGDRCFGATTESMMKLVSKDRIGVQIQSVNIPTSVSEIGKECFACCSNLTSITIPTSISTIEQDTFYLCSNLREITIPTTITKIGIGAFNTCSLLSTITLPPEIDEIPGRCFDNCTSLVDIQIPSKVVRLGCGSFQWNTFDHINLPNSITWIGDQTFTHCSNLTEITLPTSVSRLENYTFCECESLSKLKCTSNIEYIGNRCFAECAELVNINFHEKPNFSLGYIEIPEKVTFIGSSCFNKCANITQIKILGTIKEFPVDCFEFCYNLAKINIPQGTESIGSNCFRYCNSLSELHIPSSVSIIRENSFASCRKNLKVNFEPGSPIAQNVKRNGRLVKREQLNPQIKQNTLSFQNRTFPKNYHSYDQLYYHY